MSINTLALEAAANAGAVPKPPSADDGLAALTKYIPTESITLYIATISAQQGITAVAPWLTSTVAYGFFVGFTPVLMLILFLRRLAVAGQDWKLPLQAWSWWQIIASTIAFAVWALAVPGSPFLTQNSEAIGILSGLAAVFVSTLLNLVAPFFERRAA